MKPVRIAPTLILILILVIPIATEAAQPLPIFFNQLYNRNKFRIEAIVSATITNGLKKAGAKVSSPNNREKITPIVFFHLLFTSSNAVNCSKGGILDIPYFWHWVTPNPRHELIYLPSSTLLKEIKAPDGFEKYGSYADADRTPYLYLSNLVTDAPLFNHPKCGSFFTFGWCSEREMAFSNMLSQCGYKMKIKQEGIHVWSEALVEIEKEKAIGKIIIMVDNTFNTVHFERLSIAESKWMKDFGPGAQVRWYNKKALAPDELQKVRGISVGEKAAARIEGLVDDWLHGLGQ